MNYKISNQPTSLRRKMPTIVQIFSNFNTAHICKLQDCQNISLILFQMDALHVSKLQECQNRRHHLLQMNSVHMSIWQFHFNFSYPGMMYMPPGINCQFPPGGMMYMPGTPLGQQMHAGVAADGNPSSRPSKSSNQVNKLNPSKLLNVFKWIVEPYFMLHCSNSFIIAIA